MKAQNAEYSIYCAPISGQAPPANADDIRPSRWTYAELRKLADDHEAKLKTLQQKALTAFSHGALTSSAEFSSLLEAYQSEAYTLGMLHGELIEGRFQ